MTYAEDLYLLAMVLFIQCIIMLLKFVLYSMRDELDKDTTPQKKAVRSIHRGTNMCCVV